MSPVSDHSRVRIAIPYYGQRIMPRFGLARQFCLVTADLQQRQILDHRFQQWDPEQEPSVARWLKSMEVCGVICDGIHCRFQMALKAEGLWIVGGAWGNLEDVIRSWLRGNLPHSTLLTGTDQTVCCQSSRSRRRNRSCPNPQGRRKPS